MNNTNQTIQMIPYSYTKDLVLVCSIGLNIGFIVGIILL
jgi:hypothetical protein